MSSSSGAEITVSHEYMFARLHGLWSHLVRGEALEALIRSEDEEHLVRQLRGLGIECEKYDTFHRQLKVREMRLLDGIRRQVGGAVGEFYRALMRHQFFTNVKTLLHQRSDYFHEHRHDVGPQLVELPFEEPIDVEAALNAQDAASFLAALRLSPDSVEGVTACVTEFQQTKDILLAEARLDRLSYAEQHTAAAALPRGLREAALSLTGEEIDILNIGMLLRSVRTYRFGSERLSELWLRDGALLTPERLSALSGLGSVPQVVSQLPREYGGALSALSHGELYLLENRLRCGLYRRALRMLRSSQDFERILVAFPYLLRFERVNIGRVFEGVHFGVQAREMFDMMIG